MKILVIGGTGNVGGILSRTLLSEGHSVVIIARNPPKWIYEPRSPLEWMGCDRSNHRELGKLLDNTRYDFVVDLAGFHFEDVKSSWELLKSKTSHYLFMSSVAVASGVHGTPSRLPILEVPYIEEEYCSKYAKEKALTEQFLISRNEDNSGPINIILRTAEIIGVCDMRERYFITRAFSGHESLIVPNEGNNIIHPTDVRDLVDAILRLIISPNQIAGIYHVSGPYATTLRSYIEAVYRRCQSIPRIIGVSDDFIRYMKGDYYYPFFPRNTVVHSEKLKLLYNFQARYSIFESIERSMEIFATCSYTEDASRATLSLVDEQRIADEWSRIINSRFQPISDRNVLLDI